MEELMSRELYEILVCPDCKSKIVYTKDKKGLRCDKCKHTFPIEGRIPNLMPIF